MTNVLEVKDLQKTYFEYKWKNYRLTKKYTHAVAGISFSLKKGEILGVLGPNGAGKTTTIQMLLGTLIPSSGRISYFGKPFDGNDPTILKRINYSSAYIELPWRLSVAENLDIYGRIYEVKDRGARIDLLLKRFGIYDLKYRNMRALSAGQMTRVILVKAFLNSPEIILLDEPTASLDPEIAKQIRLFLLEQQKEHQVSMIFTSHNMKEVQEICNRIIFINAGKIVAEDTPLGLLKRFKQTRIRFSIETGRKGLEDYLKDKGFRYDFQQTRVTFGINEEALSKVLYKISDLGVRYQDLEILRPDLEDYFLQIAGQGKEKEEEYES